MSDLIGKRFNRWVVIDYADKRGYQKVFLCRCDCGNQKEVYASSLTTNRSKSCGCLNKEIHTSHGMTNTKEFNVWYGMVRRCTDENSHNYEAYKDRGISKEWLDFNNFFIDMGNVPEGMTIDRIDNERGYCKENCRWATPSQQSNNKKNNVFILYKGTRKTISEFAHEYGLKPSTLHQRILQYGWSIEKAINTPVATRPKDNT